MALSFGPDRAPVSDFWVDAATSGDKVSWMIGAVSLPGLLAATHTHDSHTGVLSVTEGGTGVTSLTDGGVMLGDGTNPVEVTDAGTIGSATLPDEFLHAKGGTTHPDYKGILQEVSITLEDPVVSDHLTLCHFAPALTLQAVNALA